MKLSIKFKHLFFLIFLFTSLHIFADEQAEINQLVSRLYTEKVRPLSCSDANGKTSSKLILVPERYFSSELMKYYRPVCLDLITDSNGSLIWPRDIRTSEFDPYHYSDSEAGFTNLNIGQPKITGNRATIRTTYDLPVASYKTYGNYTVFKLIKESGQWKIDDIELGGRDPDKDYTRESVTGLVSYKSVKQYIKKSLKEAEKKK